MEHRSLLEQFAATRPTAQAATLGAVRAYPEWRAEREAADFALSGGDDVQVRTYLADLRAAGASRAELRRQARALQGLYAWAAAQGLIAADPFKEFNFDRPVLRRAEIRRRQAAEPEDAREREIGRLRALNRLAGQLNRSLDVQTALDVTLQTLVEVMELRTAWAYVLGGTGVLSPAAGAQPAHDFVVAAACQLPPGLEQAERRFLCQAPDCHCQQLLRLGRLTRAVNVVECTRLQDSAEAAGDNEGLLYHASVPLKVAGRPIGLINFATEEWQFLSAADLQLLSAAGALVSNALERARLFDLVREAQARLEAELEMARQVQASLLPSPLPRIPGCDLAAAWQAAHEVAGDFYDVFAPPGTGAAPGRWVLVIGDVAGKGAPAALYMAMLKSLIHTQVEGSAGPAELLQRVNRAACAQSSGDLFASLFCGFLDSTTGRLRYASAGHNPPVLRRATLRDAPAELRPTGPLIGVFAEPEMTEREITLGPGDALVAYTDGLTEARGANQEEYGAGRLWKAVASGPRAANDLLEHLEGDQNAFTGQAEPADDITLLVLTRLPG